MINFNYQNPTHIVFGKDRLQELDQLVPTNAKVLVLYGGGSVKKFGTLDKVLAGLGDREIIEFNQIEQLFPIFFTRIERISTFYKIHTKM